MGNFSPPGYRDLSKDFASPVFHSDKCDKQDLLVPPLGLSACRWVSSYSQIGEDFLLSPWASQMCGLSLREKDTRCLFILSAYLGKNYYVVLSEAFGFHLGEFSCGSPLVIVQGNKSPSSGKKHGGENKRLKAKRSRGDVIMGTDCILSDQREEKYFAFLKVTAKFVPKGKYGSDGSLNSLSIFC